MGTAVDAIGTRAAYAHFLQYREALENPLESPIVS